MKGIIPPEYNVSLEDILEGAALVVCNIIVLVILFIFPQIVT